MRPAAREPALVLAFGCALTLLACGRSDLDALELAATGPVGGSGGASGRTSRPTGGSGGNDAPPLAGGPGVAGEPPPPSLGFDAGPSPEPECRPPPTRDSEWPMVGHDARGSANDDTSGRDLDLLAGLESRWHLRVGPEYQLDPLIAGGRLFLPKQGDVATEPTSPGRRILTWDLYDLATGRLSCGLDLGLTLAQITPAGLAPAIVDGTLYGVIDDVSGLSTLGAFDAHTGDRRWQSATFARAPWPIVAGPYVVGSGGGITGLEVTTPVTSVVRRADGAVVWSNVGSSPDGTECPASDVAVTADADWRRVLVRSECRTDDGTRRTLHAFDLQDGTELWSFRDVAVTHNNFGFTSPLETALVLVRQRSQTPGPLLFEGVGGRHLVAEGLANQDMVAFDVETGQQVWALPTHTDGGLRNTFSHRALTQGVVVIAANGASLPDPALADGRTRCPGTGLGCTQGEPVGALVMGVVAATGTLLWSRPLPALVTAGLAASGPLVFVGMADELWVLRADDGAVLAQRPLAEMLDPTPQPSHVVMGQTLVADDMLVIRVGDIDSGTLYGIPLPPAARQGSDVDAGSELDGGTE